MLHLPSFNIIDDMQGTYWSVRSDPLVIIIEFAINAHCGMFVLQAPGKSGRDLDEDGYRLFFMAVFAL